MRPSWLKALPNTLLSPLGYKLARVSVSDARQEGHDLPSQCIPTPEERREVEATLERFTGLQEPGSELADLTRWRAYLTRNRMSFFIELTASVAAVETIRPGGRVADLGSGTGYLLRVLHQRRPDLALTGFDSFAAANELASMMCPDAAYVLGSDLSANGPFDLVFCTQVLEHLVDPAGQIEHLLKVTRAGGQLVLTVPDGRRDTHSCLEKRTDGSGYWGHVNFWSPESWPLYLQSVCGPSVGIQTGMMQQGQNIAILTKSPLQKS